MKRKRETIIKDENDEVNENENDGERKKRKLDQGMLVQC